MSFLTSRIAGFAVAAVWAPTFIASQEIGSQAFEAVSIKPHKDDQSSRGVCRGAPILGNRVTLRCRTVWEVMTMALDVRDYQISIPPKLKAVADESYDIEAVAAGSVNMKRARPLLLTLLTERFQLKFHHETRVFPVYALVVGRKGARLRAGADIEASMRFNSGHLRASSASMERFAIFLSRNVDRPVLDRTKLAGQYDFELDWTPDSSAANPADSRPSLFTAVDEQLGLRLERQQSETDLIVVDRLTRASQN